MLSRLWRVLRRTPFYEYLWYLRQGIKFVAITTVLFTAAAFTYLIIQPNEYLSESEFIPPNLQRLPVNAGASVIPGSSEDIAQVISYLESEQIRDKLVELFHLVERYDLYSSNPKTRAKRIKRLINQNIQIFRTKAQTIRVMTYDMNPDTAYLINQFIIAQAERFCSNISKHRDHYQEHLKSLHELRSEMKNLEEELGIFRYKHKVFTLSDVQEAPTQTAIQLMLRNPEALRQYDKVVSMETRLRRFQELYIRLYERVEEARIFVETYPSLIIMITPPYRPEFSERPKVLRYTVLSGLAGFLISAFLVIYLGMMGFFEEDVQKRQERELIAEVS